MRKIALALTLSLIALPAFAADVKLGPEENQKPYLFDAMKDAAVRRAVTAMIKSDKLPAWTKTIVTNGNYTASAPRKVLSPMAGATLHNVCKAHDCYDNQIEILLAPDNGKAYGLLKEGEKTRFVGNPDDGAKAVLQAAMQP